MACLEPLAHFLPDRMGSLRPCRMHFGRYLCTVPSAAVLFFAALTVARAAEPPERIELRYEMFGIVGAHVATNHTTIEETADGYAITIDVESRGIAAVFVNLTTHSAVVGNLTIDGVRPQTYRGEVRRNGIQTRNGVDYGAGGTEVSEVTSTIGARPPVAAALKRGTVDQLTAFFMVERRLANLGSCALAVAVYDGLRRYDLYFSDAVLGAAPAFAEHNDVGATQGCLMRRQAIAGFLDASGRSEGAYEGQLWYARLLPGDFMIPVQVEFSTEFGKITGHLAELRSRSIHLQFRE